MFFEAYEVFFHDIWMYGKLLDDGWVDEVGPVV
jgi:hypothetical protein